MEELFGLIENRDLWTYWHKKVITWLRNYKLVFDMMETMVANMERKADFSMAKMKYVIVANTYIGQICLSLVPAQIPAYKLFLHLDGPLSRAPTLCHDNQSHTGQALVPKLLVTSNYLTCKIKHFICFQKFLSHRTT
jgi:hypothetical protein